MELTRRHECQDEDCQERAVVWVTSGKVNKNVCWDCRTKYLEKKWKKLNW